MISWGDTIVNQLVMVITLAIQASPLLILIFIQRWIITKEKAWLSWLMPSFFLILSVTMTIYLTKDFYHNPSVTSWGFVTLVLMYMALFNIPTLVLIGTSIYIQRKRRGRREMTQIDIQDIQ